MTSINWEDQIATAGEVKDEFTPIPAGVYTCVAVKAEAKESQNGNPMVSVQFAVESGPHAKRRVFGHFLPRHPEHPFIVKRFFEAMEVFGMPLDWFRENDPSLSQVASEVEGQRCDLKLSIEADKRSGHAGEKNNQIKAVLPPTGDPGVPDFGGEDAAPIPGTVTAPSTDMPDIPDAF